MRLEGKVGIIIITYNTSRLLDLQIQCIRKFCRDESYKIIIEDNSSDVIEVDKISKFCRNNNIIYGYNATLERDFSKSHAIAANWTYNKYKDKCDYLFYLDHDCFPIKDFSITEILRGNVIVGLSQGTTTKYFWPGCLFINNMFNFKGLIDFSCNSNLRLDTGGNLYKIIDTIFEGIEYIDEIYNFISDTDFYSTLYNNTFMHFIKGSNWNNNPDYEVRIKKLIEILKIKAQL